MKVLSVFIDMLGADYIHTLNPNIAETSFDKLLKQMGGTIFSNCYTPAPDTPRSSACMWSGLYPKLNGCNNRLKYPGRFYLTENHIWNTLSQNGYKIDAFAKRKEDVEIGMLPKGYNDIFCTSTIGDFLNNLTLSDNSFVFIYLNDFHSMVNAYGATKKTAVRGTEFITKLLNDIFNVYGKDTWDVIVFYSDHGFRCEYERREYLLDTDRIKTLMYIWKKGDRELTIDNRLCSNLDYYPTLCELLELKAPDNLDGCSMISGQRDSVLLEEHDDFSVRMSQTCEHWGVVLQDGIHRLEASGKWDENSVNSPEFDGKMWENIISEKMDDYSMNRRLYDALHIYDGYEIVNKEFSDGSLIGKTKKNSKGTRLVKAMWSKIKNV